VSFLDIKARTRRQVHATFAVPCILTVEDVTYALAARLHGRMVVGGDIESQGYSVTIEGVFRVIFNREELAILDVTPRRGDQVTFINYIGPGQNIAVELDARDEYEGPIDEKWSVAQFSSTAASAGDAAAGTGTAEAEAEAVTEAMAEAAGFGDAEGDEL
jgi:hypothetical protein